MEYILGNDKNCEINIVLVTGACRSGKTLISKLLSSMNNVEWIEEPWMLLQLPILYHLNLIDKDIAISCVRSYVKELLNDNVLLRNANFRPKDLSSIWNVKDPRNIFYRLNDLDTREDVSNYLGKN